MLTFSQLLCVSLLSSLGNCLVLFLASLLSGSAKILYQDYLLQLLAIAASLLQSTSPESSSALDNVRSRATQNRVTAICGGVAAIASDCNVLQKWKPILRASVALWIRCVALCTISPCHCIATRLVSWCAPAFMNFKKVNSWSHATLVYHNGRLS